MGELVKCGGLTLVELLTTLAVAGILVASASGGAAHLIEQHRASAAVNQMLGAVRFARHAAVAHRTSATLCPADGARSLQPGSARGYPSQENSLQPGSARGYPSQENSSARGNPSQESLQPGSPRGNPSQESCGRRNTWHNGALVFLDRNANGRFDGSDALLRRMPRLREGDRFYWRSFRNRSYLMIRPSGLTDWQNGNLLYCPESGDPRFARQIVINAQARVRHARDSDGDGIVEDAKGRAVECP